MLRKAVPLSWQPRGISDAIDGTNDQPGLMAALTNLVPQRGTANMWVPRSASVSLSAFPGFTTPAQVTALYTNGNIAYGFVASARFAGHDEPFAYNMVSNTFLPISGETAANTPATQPTSGDWTPPTLTQVGPRVIFTHPGFPGGATKFGWLDMSGLSDAAKTGNTHSNTTLDGLSANVLQAGWQPGMAISGATIPASTTIVAIAAGGLSLTLSQAASGTQAGVALTVTGGTPTAPQWGAGDTNLRNLAAIPVAVAQFFGRAYYAVNTGTTVGVTASDAGVPCQVGDAITFQTLTFNDGLAVTAMAGQNLNTQLGGVIAGLYVFQGQGNIRQITGDFATYDIRVQSLNTTTGTIAPLSLAVTPKGLLFVASDGLRLIDTYGNVSDPIGAWGAGIELPFIFALTPTRIAAAFNENVYRVSLNNGTLSGSPRQEYWYHLDSQAWSGPHTFPADFVQPYEAANSFIIAATGVNAQLWQSDVLPGSAAVFTENGNPMSWVYTTLLLPDNQEQQMNAIIESTLFLGLGSGSNPTVTVNALDDAGNVLDTVMIQGPGGSPTAWGAFSWGQAPWGGSGGGRPLLHPINWHLPLVARQLQISVNGFSGPNQVIGNLNLRYQRRGYQLARVA